MFHRFLATAALIVALPVAAQAAAADPLVVVELFTSQGCSSCPPADAYLSDLSHNRPDVLPLAFHVTYWNNLGWKDPFSFDAATQRQATYAARFGDGSYTPEMVVDGRHGLVGSDRSSAEAAIAAAKQVGGTSAAVSATPAGTGISINVGAGSGHARVMLVGYDAEHSTPVGRGENNGRVLTESNIVRSIQTVGLWTGAPLSLNAAIPAGEKAAVILEAPDGSIVGAARVGTPS
ncbi:hypothetical protein AX768_30665 (plasmid) [Burkholderia sp. PAMC 28687]|uniref:DUF1223 domain-containing protein n=1 Tax=Burkholderia sp. PAMC 28687 TaxID=1795874 RepID=UPI0007805152|nr:DUF1223 domain-containing protein [Burkholderia sp. PAMC 28687]AMM18590.1 hypothetical protein AX768_30665 [Burkholderia sp. PAMC 28687]